MQPSTCHDGMQLDHLMKYHASWMRSDLGSVVEKDHASISDVLQHLCNLCSIAPTDGEFVVNGNSALWTQLNACRALISQALRQNSTMNLQVLDEAHCITASFRDAANLPGEQTFHLFKPRSLGSLHGITSFVRMLTCFRLSQFTQNQSSSPRNLQEMFFLHVGPLRTLAVQQIPPQGSG